MWDKLTDERGDTSSTTGGDTGRLKSLCLSGWNPPPSNRRLMGDMAYLQVTTSDDLVPQKVAAQSDDPLEQSTYYAPLNPAHRTAPTPAPSLLTRVARARLVVLDAGPPSTAPLRPGVESAGDLSAAPPDARGVKALKAVVHALSRSTASTPLSPSALLLQACASSSPAPVASACDSVTEDALAPTMTITSPSIH